MLAIRQLISAAILAALGLMNAAADWPQWRGPNRNGISQDTGLLPSWPKVGPKLLWTFEKAGVGYSGPAVVGDRLYIMGSDDPDKGGSEFVLCIDTREGKELWRQEISTAEGEYLTNWGSGPRSTPAVDGDRVYILGAKGDLQCLQCADGSKVWGLNLVKDLKGKIPGWGYCESVLIDGDRLLCTPGGNDGAIACLKKDTGEAEWRSTDLKDGAAYSSIVIDSFGVKQYVTLSDKGLISVRASDGKLQWRSNAGKNGTAIIPTAIVYDKFVFATSGYGSGCGLVELSSAGGNSVKARDVYLNKAMINHHGGVIRVGEYIYGYSDDGGWICLDFLKLDKEKEEPEWKNKSLDKGSLTYADGHLYCYGQGKGICVLIEANPKEWKETGRFEIPRKTAIPRKSGAIWTHPVVANGKLFLRDHELLFCYDLKKSD